MYGLISKGVDCDLATFDSLLTGKGVTVKEKNLLPQMSKPFRLRVIHFKE